MSKCHEKKILYFYQMPTSKYILWTIKYSHSVINEYLTAAAVVLARENWCYKTSTISLYSAPAPNFYLFTSNLLLWSFVAFIYLANILFLNMKLLFSWNNLFLWNAMAMTSMLIYDLYTLESYLMLTWHKVTLAYSSYNSNITCSV